MAGLELNKEIRCLVVGGGEMGRAHAKVLVALLGGATAVWAPSERNRQNVINEGAQFIGGKELFQAVAEFSPSHVIIASPVEELPIIAQQMLSYGVRNILLEKPAIIDVQSGKRLLHLANNRGASIQVAYNRRFYASVRTAEEMINREGESLTSIWFEFTEWAHLIEGLINQSLMTKARWLLANSMHVIDLALFPCGLPNPDESAFFHAGSLAWHPSASVFAGAGLAADGTPYSYCANWDAPGRWGVEWLTSSARYIFRPMERLHVMRRGSISLDEVSLVDDLDQRFKPGVYLQDLAFLSGERGRLPDLRYAIALVELAAKMSGYPSV